MNKKFCGEVKTIQQWEYVTHVGYFFFSYAQEFKWFRGRPRRNDAGLPRLTTIMLPAHFHDAAGDLFTIVEKFWDCSKFWQCSCYIVLCSLNSCDIRVVFAIFRIMLLYFVLGSEGAPVEILTKLVLSIVIYRRQHRQSGRVELHLLSFPKLNQNR